MQIKIVKVTNSKNVLVQLPGFVVNKWKLQDGDALEVSIAADEKSIIIKPRKGYIKVSTGSNVN